mmetsp:Transcript_106415/g.185106  ORF Transcript_106415/g.185106 Transcript_106415/m.185106 type:complete len:413 (+) Transcript_106415:109-1347(+)
MAEASVARAPTLPTESSTEAQADAFEEDVELVAELDGQEAVAPVTVLPDATLLMEDDANGYPCSGLGEAPGCQEQPVLSLVSLNPRTAATVDILRGQLTVLPELPDQSVAVRTVRISCGRDAANTIVLKDGRISLRHFTVRVRAAAGGRVVLDLLDQSSNGTWVDGRKVGRGRRVPLVVGDRIVALPASLVGREGEVGYVLLYDTKGAWCSAGASSSESGETASGSQEDASKAQDSACGSSEQPVAAAPPKGLPRDLEQDLRCGVCTDLLHRCLTIVPCGHNFCAACLVRWRRCSAQCPGCRELVRQAVRNLDVDRCVETFIKEHPEAARSAAELMEQDAWMSDPDSAGVLRWLLRDKEPTYGQMLATSNPYAVATPQRHRTRPARAPERVVQPEQEQRQSSSGHSSVCVIS